MRGRRRRARVLEQIEEFGGLELRDGVGAELNALIAGGCDLIGGLALLLAPGDGGGAEADAFGADGKGLSGAHGRWLRPRPRR